MNIFYQNLCALVILAPAELARIRVCAYDDISRNPYAHSFGFTRTHTHTHTHTRTHTHTHTHVFTNLKKRFEHIELPAKLLDYFLRSNKSNVNQSHTLSLSLSLTHTHTHLRRSVVPCGAVWRSVLQCVAVCRSVLQCVAVCCGKRQPVFTRPVAYHVRHVVAMCCSVLQCVAVCCIVLQCVAVKDSQSFTRPVAYHMCLIKDMRVQIGGSILLCSCWQSLPAPLPHRHTHTRAHRRPAL